MNITDYQAKALEIIENCPLVLAAALSNELEIVRSGQFRSGSSEQNRFHENGGSELLDDSTEDDWSKNKHSIFCLSNRQQLEGICSEFLQELRNVSNDKEQVLSESQKAAIEVQQHIAALLSLLDQEMGWNSLRQVFRLTSGLANRLEARKGQVPAPKSGEWPFDPNPKLKHLAPLLTESCEHAKADMLERQLPADLDRTYFFDRQLFSVARSAIEECQWDWVDALSENLRARGFSEGDVSILVSRFAPPAAHGHVSIQDDESGRLFGLQSAVRRYCVLRGQPRREEYKSQSIREHRSIHGLSLISDGQPDGAVKIKTNCTKAGTDLIHSQVLRCLDAIRLYYWNQHHGYANINDKKFDENRSGAAESREYFTTFVLAVLRVMIFEELSTEQWQIEESWLAQIVRSYVSN